MLASSALAAGTVVAVEAGGIVSGFSNPEIVSSSETTIVFDDSTPEALSVGGVVAQSAGSAFQRDIIVLKLVIRTTWAMRASGLVQFLTGATW